MPDVLQRVAEYWDVDAATYDLSASHRPRSEAELEAWRTSLAPLLPPAPARVLDVGAGTGFVSLLVAGMGYDVTAIDMAPRMLERQRAKAAEAAVPVTTILAPAHEPPPGPFDVVIERHVTWTLPDPVGTLAAWRAVAPQGRLVLLEGCWGTAAGPAEQRRAQLRRLAARARRTPPNHHAEYEADLRDALPFGRGTVPEALRSVVLAAGWRDAAVHRLRDVDRAAAQQQPRPERWLGATPRFAVTAHSGPQS